MSNLIKGIICFKRNFSLQNLSKYFTRFKKKNEEENVLFKVTVKLKAIFLQMHCAKLPQDSLR